MGPKHRDIKGLHCIPASYVQLIKKCNFIINMDEKVWIQISWLHQKSADPDLQYKQKQAPR